MFSLREKLEITVKRSQLDLSSALKTAKRPHTAGKSPGGHHSAGDFPGPHTELITPRCPRWRRHSFLPSPDGIPATMSFYKQDSGADIQGKDRKTRLSEICHRHARCLVIILILVIIVVLLPFILTVRKEKTVSEVHVHPACPPPWIGFGNKCFYFSEDMGNWTYSQTFCNSLGADLVQIDSVEELTFLKRYKGPDDHWIGLERESPSHSWKWINGTALNSVFQVTGTGEHAYLNEKGVSSGRIYSERKWICSKPNVSTRQIASNS
ncbi:C-type lectin domain family 2 member D-like isoform X2 [Sorex araneus]|uniref:C-type lectin domain family 2 member D-like isoform X2 n=1 Tax=Sorex araneus TaxID=42254 RepID=UPI002433447B|nr:C-type lectin domain family 2 member D-like isoform X2 [Sorex araneus]